MELKRGIIREYSREIKAASTSAADAMEAALRQFMEENPNASVEDLRNAAMNIVGQVVETYGNAAGVVSMQVFDSIMDAEGVPTGGAVLYEGPDYDAISKGAHYQARWLTKGKQDRFVEEMRQLTEYHVRRAANQTAIDSVERQSGWRGSRSGKASKVRYARVPTGGETCTYCTMLASRGFVYRTSESAGHAQHRDCDCLVVPGLKGQTSIAGYDPKTMERLWHDFEEIDGMTITDEDGNELRGAKRAEVANQMKQEAKERRLGRSDWDS